MRSLLRIGMLALVAGLGSGVMSAPLAAQDATTVDAALKSRVERRFRVLPVRDGLVLTPRHEVRGLQSIEIRDGVIAVDGTATTGAQLRERLGADADLVLQVSYLSPEALAGWSAPKPAPAPVAPMPPPPPTGEQTPGEPEAADQARPPSPDEPPSNIHWRKSSAKVHIGSSITVGEDELVTDPVVSIGGNVTVLGRVDDDVVAVGGSVRLGPKARVRGDVTAVGGSVDQERGASIGGTVNEVRIGPQFNFKPWHVFDGMWFDGWDVVSDGFRLLGTVMRVSLVLLLVLLVALIAARPVQRIADRVGRDPWLSGFIGLMAQLLFIPVLVLTIVVLAVSIIGIPLLLLVPFGIIGFLIAMLVGFSGVALRIGRWAVGGERPAFVALAVGVVLVSAVALVARTLALLPIPLWPISWFLAFSAFFLEYVAWTVGLGGAVLTRFGTRGPAAPFEITPPPLPIVSGPTEA
jgi:hypothetical protein